MFYVELKWLVAKDEFLWEIGVGGMVPDLNEMIADLQTHYKDQDEMKRVINQGLINFACREMIKTEDFGYSMTEWKELVELWRKGNYKEIWYHCVTNRTKTPKITPKPHPFKQRSHTPPSPSPFVNDNKIYTTPKKKGDNVDQVVKVADDNKKELEYEQDNVKIESSLTSTPATNKSKARGAHFDHNMQVYIAYALGIFTREIKTVRQAFESGMYTVRIKTYK